MNIKRLKKEIKRLKKENQFLQVGIDSREDAFNYVNEQLTTQSALTQELFFLIEYMSVIEKSLLTNDLSTNARTVKRAITNFKMEITEGFYANHLINKINKDTNDIAQWARKDTWRVETKPLNRLYKNSKAN